MSSSLKHSSYYDTKSFSSFFEGQSSSFTVLSFNTASIRSQFHQIDIFFNELSVSCHPPISAICVQETWLSEEDDSLLFNLKVIIVFLKIKRVARKEDLIYI